MKLNSLTDEQVKLMEVVKREWIDLLDACPRPNRDAIMRGVKWLYRFCKLKEPLVIVVQSPLGAQIEANMLKAGEVWAQVRAQVWDQVWAQVRAQVGAQVRAQVRAQVWDQVRAQVWAQVGAQVRAQVWAQVRAQVWAQVRAQVGAQVGDQVWDQVWAQVGDQVGDQVGAQKFEYHSFASYGSLDDFGWLAFYDFFERIGIAHKVEAFASFRTLMQSGVYDMIQLDGACIVVEMPTEIHREATERRALHSVSGPAIKFGDGYQMHSLWGVRFDAELFERVTQRQIKAKDVLKIENMEQRMAALKFLGAESVLAAFDSKIVAEERGYKLHAISGLTDEIEYALQYECPSTARGYVSFVPPEIGKTKDALAAVAWKFGLDKTDWDSIGAHS
jgi:hypothetical protein